MLHRAQIDINTLSVQHQEPTAVLDHLLLQVADLEAVVILDILPIPDQVQVEEAVAEPQHMVVV
jgi:hypothetical protein